LRGIPLVCYKDIYRMNSPQERFMFSLLKILPAGLTGKYAVSVMERKAGWKPHVCGESMNSMFERYVRPNWRGIGWSTHVQYRGWGFDAGKVTSPVRIYYSKGDKMIPSKIVEASALKLESCKLFSYENEERYSERMLEDLFKSAGTQF
jgi:hypothetical protein